MNFSTNQVMQFFCVNDNYTYSGNDVVENADRSKVKVVIPGSGIVSDIIDRDKIISATVTDASSMTISPKALAVKLADGVSPIVGEEYIINLQFTDAVSQEVVFNRVISAKATTTTAKDLYKALVDSATAEYSVADAPSFYNVYKLTSDGELGDLITGPVSADDVQYGFAIVEATPDWSLGRFPFSLMGCSATTKPIVVDAECTNTWLAGVTDTTTAQFTDELTKAAGIAFPNSPIVADMEYFAMGEKGTRDPKCGWPLTPDVRLKVDGTNDEGYSILNIHYYHTGAFDSVQKSEKELVIVGVGDDIAEQFDELKESIEKVNLG